jgi:hypothetical protein
LRLVEGEVGTKGEVAKNAPENAGLVSLGRKLNRQT